MAKQSTEYSCSICGYRPPKWVGCCPECSHFGSISAVVSSLKHTAATAPTLTQLKDIPLQPQQRMKTEFAEWDRVVGGGIIPGSFTILTGDPGIGKSTLLLQIANELAKKFSIIYFSSEESLEQMKQRSQRLSCLNDNLLCSDEANIESIINTCQQQKPHIIIIDSIQNCFSADTQVLPGSVGQLREAGFKLMRLAKEHTIAVMLTGHITKEGSIAGPKMLEHMVDAVFYLQGEDRWQTRVLRAVKNRFGALGELGFFQMDEHGLNEVPDINQYLLNEATFNPGSVLISTIEGSRPFLLELQALLVPTKFGMPQRVITGIDQKQVLLIAAILEKYLHIKLSAHDIFFKVSGGFRIKDSGADLGIALALLSSYFQQSLPKKSITLGEMSLTGSIKAINQIGMHLKEAQKFGIQHYILAQNQKIELSHATTNRFFQVYELLKLFDNQ